MFNLSKTGGKKKALETSEKQLYKERDDMGTADDNSAGTTNQRLDAVREDPKGDETTQNQLEEVREGNVTEGRTTDGQLGHHETPAGYEPLRVNTEKRKFYGLPVNELDEANDQKMAKALDASDSLDADTEFWDKTFEKIDSIKPGPSQLQNNQTRVSKLTPENVATNPDLKEMVIASLKDADAMLFHIYYTAALSNREINATEQTLVEGISQDKMKIAHALGLDAQQE